MDTKKAIEFIKNTMYVAKENDIEEDDMPQYQSKYNHWMRYVIELLQRGEECKQTLTEIEDFIGSSDITIDEFEKIKQKYFPEPKSRWQKINDILEQLNSPGIQTDVKALKNLLIELRDEECDCPKDFTEKVMEKIREAKND